MRLQMQMIMRTICSNLRMIVNNKVTCRNLRFPAEYILYANTK